MKKKTTEQTVRVQIPKNFRNDSERFVAVNGERLLIQTGKPVEVPERFAAVLENSERMAAVSAKYIDENIAL